MFLFPKTCCHFSAASLLHFFLAGTLPRNGINFFMQLYAFCTSISLLIKVKKKELKESMEKKKRDEAKRLQEEQGKPAALAAATAADGPAPKANSDNAGIAAVASAAEETKKER